jgi:hypothetical protein
VTVLAFCTDKGTHPTRQLAWLLEEVDLAGDVTIALVPWAPGRTIRDVDRPTYRGRTLQVPPCPTCPRAPRLRQPRALRLYRALVATERGGQLDISYLAEIEARIR